MNEHEVLEVAKALRAYAGHFSPRDWDWTRKHSIHRILYRNRRHQTRSGKTQRFDPSRMPYRVQSAVEGLLRDGRRRVTRNPSELDAMFGKVGLWRMFRTRLTDNNRPDGHLDGGNVIVYWEETGEYLQFVQPTVGLLIADFLEDRPGDAHAQAIAGEMRRIMDRYHERVVAGEVTGRPDGS